MENKHIKIMQKIIIVSGYFNPIHPGHINLFKVAKRLGDKLIIILNNDYQVKIKNSVLFMNQSERKKVVESIKYVDCVVISIDKDMTVCKTLQSLYNRFSKSRRNSLTFANGGDRRKGTIPEDKICKKLNIKMVYNIGGGKSQSSSWLIGLV